MKGGVQEALAKMVVRSVPGLAPGTLCALVEAMAEDEVVRQSIEVMVLDAKSRRKATR